MFPSWFHALSLLLLLVGLACAVGVAIDVGRHPQAMAIMNVVWPVTALFGTVLTVWAYVRYGRLATRSKAQQAHRQGVDPPAKRLTPFPAVVAKGALHCGSGCMIGDVIAEWLAFLVPAVAGWFGWHWLFADKIFAVWGLDFVFAFLIGIVFQYFAIAPMRDLSVGEGIIAAIKADTLSLASWQVGMYGFMALAHFYLYAQVFGTRAEVDTPEFWAAMQVAMLAGFATAYPVNWWLIRSGLKEAM